MVLFSRDVRSIDRRKCVSNTPGAFSRLDTSFCKRPSTNMDCVATQGRDVEGPLPCSIMLHQLRQVSGSQRAAAHSISTVKHPRVHQSTENA